MIVIATVLWCVFIDSPFFSFDLRSRISERYLAHGEDCHSFGYSTIGVSLIF